MEFSLPIIVVVLIVVLYLLSSIKILAEYERGVIFRLGHLLPQRQRARASSWCSRPSIALCASPCGRKRSRFRRRTSLRAIT